MCSFKMARRAYLELLTCVGYVPQISTFFVFGLGKDEFDIQGGNLKCSVG